MFLLLFFLVAFPVMFPGAIRRRHDVFVASEYIIGINFDFVAGSGAFFYRADQMGIDD